MARILKDGEWYEPVAPGAVYESEFEKIVVSQGQHLFPDYVVVPFATIVESEYGGAMADLALIDRQYRFWWVVEVELATHSLEGHVRPQVRILSHATYGSAEAIYLGKRSPELDVTRLGQMMKGTQPRVVVVVNAPVPSWNSPLQGMGAIVSVLVVYRSNRNRYAFDFGGEYPDLPHNVISYCHRDPMMPRLLVVESPGGLPPAAEDRFTIRFLGGITTWLKVEIADTVWLQPYGPISLEGHARYVLSEGEDGGLDLVKEAQNGTHD